MNLTIVTAVMPLFTHFTPILYFVYMMMDVLLRNRRSIEHRLAFGIIACCMLMFIEEFIRHYLPISYSPLITAAWFSTAGITITGFGLHLFIRLARLHYRMPRYLFPYLCYLPTVIVLLNLFFNDQMVSGGAFQEIGIWKQPVYNTAYYAAMIGSNVFNILYITILLYGKKHADTDELKDIYNLLMLGVLSTLAFNMGVGLIDFQGYLPPYPYIYGTIVWCILLRHTMLKYDFLNHTDKRYEKLFNLNPAAILLIDVHGQVKEANPSAKQLFRNSYLEHTNIYAELDESLMMRINDREEIRNCEMSIIRGDQKMDVVVDGDFVMVENEPHMILIVRDVTTEKMNQREITFLAYHDALTRLPNRRSFLEKLDMAIQEARERRQKLAVILFDVDYFKGINDKFGHFTGDQALLLLADQLRSVIQPGSGMAARLGGDEFIFYLHPVASISHVEAVIRKLQDALEEATMLVGEDRLSVRISLGASIYPDNGTDADTLLSNADKALYYVKRNGRNHYVFLSQVEHNIEDSSAL